MYKIPLDEDWSFLIDRELIQICIGPFDIQLHFSNHVSISIHGENSAEAFHHKTDSMNSLVAQGMAGGAISLISLLQTTVKSAISEDPTTLSIHFSNGEELRIFDSSDIYESFTVKGPKGLIVI